MSGSVPASTTVYLISGANRGIGLGFVEALSARPDTLVFAGTRQPSDSDRLHQLSEERGNVRVVKLTAADVEDNTAAAAEVRRVAGRVDVVIANAGVAFMAPAATSDLSSLRHNFEVNTVGPLLLFQCALPLLQQSNSPKFLLISSIAGSLALQQTLPFPVAGYGATKAAANYITRKLHFEHEKEGLVAFPVHPGWVQSDSGNAAARGQGMKEAPLPVADCVAGIMRMLDAATRDSHSGRFWSYDGTELAW